jgi:molybdopterin synthase sulfur carrier subunit
MAVRVLIPTPLQRLTQNQAEVMVEGSDIQELIGNLEVKFPGMKARLCDEQGTLRRFVNIYLNEEDIRFLKGEATPVKDGDEVSIVPAIAGGTHV